MLVGMRCCLACDTAWHAVLMRGSLPGVVCGVRWCGGAVVWCCGWSSHLRADAVLPIPDALDAALDAIEVQSDSVPSSDGSDLVACAAVVRVAS